MSQQHTALKHARKIALVEKIKQLYGEQLPCTAFLGTAAIKVRSLPKLMSCPALHR